MSILSVLSDEQNQPCVANIVGGQPRLLPTTANFPVVSSLTNETIHYGQTVTPELLSQAIESAEATFLTYRRLPVHERRGLLLRAADLFDQHAEEVIRRAKSETGCDDSWARLDARIAAAFIREAAASMAQELEGQIGFSQGGYTNLVFKVPVGPVLIIPPWNSPVALCTRGVVNALAAGCTVVLKASELCPWSQQFVVSVFQNAGFPPGSLNMVMAQRDQAVPTTETLIAHPAIRKIEFIGSANVGRSIAAMGGKYLKPVTLELGDQSPAIVWKDADLERAAEKLAFSVTVHQGQVCFATERIIVHADVMDEFATFLKDKMNKIKPESVTVTRAAADRAQKLIEAAITDGAQYLYQGSPDEAHPARLSPSLLVNVNKNSALYHDELFAPSATVVVVHSKEEAVAEANSRAGGLSAAIFTRDLELALDMARDLDFGGVQVNNHTCFAEVSGPATGVKGSGWGSNNGKYGIAGFLVNKAVSLVPTKR